MENSGFLKTVNFGGFDKKDVLAYVDSLNTKIYTLEAELQEAKANAGDNSSADLDEMLAKERAKSGELKAKVDTLTLTIQSNEDLLKTKDGEITKLKSQVEELEDKLANAPKNDVEASAVDISNVFIEAQKSANAVVAQAKENAKKMDADAKALAEEVVNDANAKAARIIYDAERQSDGVKAAAAAAKAAIKDDIDKLMSNVSVLGSTIAEFTKSSTDSIEKAKSVIGDTQKSIENGNFGATTKSSSPISSAPKSTPKSDKPAKASVNMGDLGDLLNAVEAEAKKGNE